tara:strand:+ start:397 stop:1638 length:1242 start_codon:yes stop_codon:yes gene_type:complete
MSSENFIGIIELGNVYLKCIIFEDIQDASPKIISSHKLKSIGISNGTITDISKASQCIRSCISEAEKIGNITLKKINVIFEQPEFLCTKFSKSKKINGAKIQINDINFLLKEGKKEVLQNDEKHKIIHIFNHNYVVDGKKFNEEPIGFYAEHLSHEMTFLTAPKNNIKNIYQTFINSDIEVERYISCNFALAAQLLNAKELKEGSILIDIGLEKIGVCFFKNFALINSFTIPIGFNHITKDISKVCLMDLQESEIIKNKLDFSFESNSDLFSSAGFLKNIYFKSTDYRKISKSLIVSIVESRLNEIFKIIKKNLLITDNKSTFSKNFFITGFNSLLLNLEHCFSNYFKISVKKKYQKDNMSDDENIQNSLNFDPCFGALKIIRDGWETEAIPISRIEESNKIGFFKRIFGNRL